MVRHIYEIMVTLGFIFRLVLCSCEDRYFIQHYLSECTGRHQTFLFVNVIQEKPTRTQLKGDNVKTFIKTSKCENLVVYFSEIIQKNAVFAMLFWFSVTKQSLESGFGFPNDKKFPRYSLVLKVNVTLAWPLRLVILYFLMEILVR